MSRVARNNYNIAFISFSAICVALGLSALLLHRPAITGEASVSIILFAIFLMQIRSAIVPPPECGKKVADRHPERLKTLEHIPGLSQCESLLFVGFNDLSVRKWPPFFEQMGFRRVVILEAWKQNVEMIREMKKYEVVEGDVRQADDYFQPESFDLVIWWHGPEHVPFEQLGVTFDKLKRIARRYIVVGCPWGHYSRRAFGGNPFEVHHCHLDTGFFEDMGFKTATVGRRNKHGSHITAWWDKRFLSSV